MMAGPIRRVSVVGSSGSGKTTFGARLAARLRVPHIELDAIWWGPNWTHLDAETFARRVDAATEADAWVCDGNFSAVRPIVLERADAVVWLDLSLRTCLARMLRRTARRIRSGEQLWAGNRESWREVFVGREALFWWSGAAAGVPVSDFRGGRSLAGRVERLDPELRDAGRPDVESLS